MQYKTRPISLAKRTFAPTFLAALVVTALGLAGCSGGGSTPTPPVSHTVDVAVTTNTPIVVTNPYGGVTLTIPANSVPASTSSVSVTTGVAIPAITSVTPVSGSVAPAPTTQATVVGTTGVSLAPAGLQLNAPATVNIPYNPAGVAPGSIIAIATVDSSAQAVFNSQTTSSVDGHGNTVATASISQFTTSSQTLTVVTLNPWFGSYGGEVISGASNGATLTGMIDYGGNVTINVPNATNPQGVLTGTVSFSNGTFTVTGTVLGESTTITGVLINPANAPIRGTGTATGGLNGGVVFDINPPGQPSLPSVRR